MQGILLHVTMEDRDGNISKTPQVSSYKELTGFYDDGAYHAVITADAALEFIRNYERQNVSFDMQSAEGDAEREEYRKQLETVEALAWSEPNADGQLALESVWVGGLKDMGVEYRFVPITV